MKRLPEKLMVAAIILSCGFVLQSEQPGEPQAKVKDVTELRVKRMVAASEASQTDRVETVARHEDRVPR